MKPIIEKINIGKSPLEVFEFFKDKPHSFFLDSASDPTKLGKFSFMGFEPFLIIKSKKDLITIERKGKAFGQQGQQPSDSNHQRECVARERPHAIRQLHPAFNHDIQI